MIIIYDSNKNPVFTLSNFSRISENSDEVNIKYHLNVDYNNIHFSKNFVDGIFYLKKLRDELSALINEHLNISHVAYRTIENDFVLKIYKSQAFIVLRENEELCNEVSLLIRCSINNNSIFSLIQDISLELAKLCEN